MNDRLQEYNVIWDSPSRDSSGSMPLGNGDIGLNVWVEADGDLLLLIAKSDAWDENSINLKLGRIRIKVSPNPFKSGEKFRQTLRLRTAEIEIDAASIRFRIWVDANHPVIRIEAESEVPFEMEASLEMWRTSPRSDTDSNQRYVQKSGGQEFGFVSDHYLARSSPARSTKPRDLVPSQRKARSRSL